MTKTRFPSPRSHTSFKNYEIWNLAITSHPGSNKSGFVEFRGHMQNDQFHGLCKFHSDLSENSFGHNFFFPMKIRFFRFVRKVFTNRFKYFWFHSNPFWFAPGTVSQSLNSNFETTAPSQALFIIQSNYIYFQKSIQTYFSSLLFKIFKIP